MMDPSPIPRPRTSSAAIASLVCGLIGCIPFLSGLAAVTLGIVGIKKTRDPMVSGRGMAITGLVLGALSLVGWTLGVVTVAGGAFYVYRAAEPARSTAEQFTRNLSEGKVDAAVALSVEGVDRAPLIVLSERMKTWGALQRLGMTSINIQDKNNVITYGIGGESTFVNTTKSYSMTLTKTGESYKVVKFDFSDGPP